MAAVWDWRLRRIPNWLTVSGLAGAVILRGFLLGLNGVWDGLAGFGLAFAAYLGLFLLRAMGGGDLKLMAALGSVTGPKIWFNIFILSSILGGIVALVLLIWHRAFRRGMQRVARIVLAMVRGKAPYSVDPGLDIAAETAITSPHGVVVAVGTWLYLFFGTEAR